MIFLSFKWTVRLDRQGIMIIGTKKINGQRLSFRPSTVSLDAFSWEDRPVVYGELWEARACAAHQALPQRSKGSKGDLLGTFFPFFWFCVCSWFSSEVQDQHGHSSLNDMMVFLD